MRNKFLILTCAIMLTAEAAGVSAMAQENATEAQASRQTLQKIHTPQSIDQELARLTKDLELTSDQQKQVKPLLQQHHDKIQALLDKNPTLSRQDLQPQIHAISDETHRQIGALLTDHQKQLVKAMLTREHNGEERRRPEQPSTTQPDAPSSVS